MGLFFSTLYKRFWALYIQYSSAFKRSSLSPGIPLPNPTCAYWTVPSASISQCGADSETIPQDADIVIIGSGITGTSIVRALLKESGPDSRLRVVMLEARDICSGATARCATSGLIYSPILTMVPQKWWSHNSGLVGCCSHLGILRLR